MKGHALKILLVGSRYTGKGQIGRAWARTEADLPTLQPVILYERMVDMKGYAYRVVAWVLSFDSEFTDLRSAFYSHADGIILTYDANDITKRTFEDLQDFIEEIKKKYPGGHLPPAVTFGTRLTDTVNPSEALKERFQKWSTENEYDPVILGLVSDKYQFQEAVEEVFSSLLNKIFKYTV
jgi:GTPase SAR1 family protein